MHILRLLLEDVIKNLQNAPALEYLSLSKIPVTLEDLEEIHTNASNLKSLSLTDLELLTVPPTTEYYTANYFKPHMLDIVPLKPASHQLKIIKIAFFYLDIINQQQNIIRWLKYIGRKYTYVDTVSFYVYAPDDRDLIFRATVEMFESAVLDVLANMKNLMSYGLSIIPITGNIMKAMDDNNGINLKHMKLVINQSNAEEQFIAIQSLRQKKS